LIWSDYFHENRTHQRFFGKFRLKLLYRKLVSLFLLTILDPPGGYRFLARRRVRPSPFLVDRPGFEPAAFRSSQAERLCEPNVLRPDKRQYTRLNHRARKTPKQAFFFQRNSKRPCTGPRLAMGTLLAQLRTCTIRDRAGRSYSVALQPVVSNPTNSRNRVTIEFVQQSSE
jgi:hypothetical protein